ncbi:hypothetical protein [Flavobacterium sp.]|uniref:hypothetical protein n=1 Tax=Flavobacterium sp. TaxID=239 RepID=UPI003919725F
MESNNPWRKILTFGILIFALVRIALLCSRTQQAPTISPVNQSVNNALQMQQENLQRIRETQYAEAPKALYTPYQELRETEDIVLLQRGIQRLAQDSLFPFDINTSIRLTKETMFLTHPPMPIRFGFKSTDNTVTYVIEYEGEEKGNIWLKQHREAFKLSKKEASSERTDQLFYQFQQEGTSFNGYGVSTSDQGVTTLMIVESPKLSSAQLQTHFLTFALTNFVKVQKKETAHSVP